MSKRLPRPDQSGVSAFVVMLSAEKLAAWRRPLANGVSGESGPPTKWSVEEKIAGSLPCEASGAMLIVWNDQIFLNVVNCDDERRAPSRGPSIATR